MTEDGFNQLADAIFSKEGALVFEAYSSYGQMPVHFQTAFELSRYFSQQLSQPKGLVDVVITYPDMEGAAELGRIKLDPEKCNGHTERYSYRGWGLIAVQISNETKSLTRVAANTEKRANKLVGTHPEIMPPSTWQWGAVASHARRLQRVLKRVT